MKSRLILVLSLLSCYESDSGDFNNPPGGAGGASAITDEERGFGPPPTPDARFCVELDAEDVARQKLDAEVVAALANGSAQSVMALRFRAAGLDEAACLAERMRQMGDAKAHMVLKSVFGSLELSQVMEMARLKAVVRVAVVEPESTTPFP